MLTSMPTQRCKPCPRCSKNLPLLEFSAQKNGRCGRHSICKNCVSTRMYGHPCLRRLTPEGRVTAFWQGVDKHGPVHPRLRTRCWVWTRSVVRGGYGRFRAFGEVYAHKIAWQLAHGPIQYGQLVLHHCDVPCCVRASHLYLGTYLDNLQDAYARHRMPLGEDHHKSKLSAVMVIDIRRRCIKGETQQSLAAQYGVAQTTISAVVRRKTWSHLL